MKWSSDINLMIVIYVMSELDISDTYLVYDPPIDLDLGHLRSS